MSESSSNPAQLQLNFQFGSYEFTPKLISIVGVMLLLPLLLWLGFWQLDRAEQKRMLLQEYDQRGHEKPLYITQIKGFNESLRYKSVVLSGKFDNKKIILLDNKFHEHQPGFQVITPLRVNGTKKVMLVNRGWVPLGKNRQTLPNITAITQQVKLKGIIDFPSTKGFILGDNFENNGYWPLVIQQVKIKQLQTLFKEELYPFTIKLDPKAKFGFIRQWDPVVMKPQKHLGYAFQWFALAFTLLVIFLGVNMRKNKELKDE